MTSLATLLRQRATSSNLGSERTTAGVVYYKTAAHPTQAYLGYNTLTSPACTWYGHNEYCWVSPGTGRAVVEMWGPGGMASKMCCCASPQVPPNPGAYVKKTINVDSNSYVCGVLGASPSNCIAYNNNLCTGGGARPCASMFTLCHIDGCSCLCAQGGCNGVVYCMTNISSCLVAGCFGNAFDITYINDCFCSIICNQKASFGSNTQAVAYGGDINVHGGISSIFLRCWNDACFIGGRVENRMALPAGYFTSDSPFYLNYLLNSDCNTFFGFCNAYSGRQQMINALSSATGHIGAGAYCWNCNLDCTCYEYSGLTPMPAGFPAPVGVVCPNVRNTGHIGGHGAIKITYLADS